MDSAWICWLSVMLRAWSAPTPSEGSRGSKKDSVRYRLTMPRWLLVARTWLLQFIVTEVIGENCCSTPYFYITGWRRLAANFLVWRFQTFVWPSPRPAQRNSECFEKAKELTGEVLITYYVPPDIMGSAFAWIVWTFLPFALDERTIWPSSEPAAMIWLLWLQARAFIFWPYELLVHGKTTLGWIPVPPLVAVL